MRRNTKGFTLIELLIVVAIIAILAAIAIPNFLAAQIRAKVSRARGELRTIAVALESYYVDNNVYPDDIDYPWPWYVPSVVTTPIAYITDNQMADPFRATLNLLNDPRARRYRYLNYLAENNGHWAPGTSASWPGYDYPNAKLGQIKYGGWRLSSSGPDMTAGPGYGMADDSIYDPSNGTVSYGDLIRSQNSSQQQ
jgi:prepilin-type N-terminal cleavage/methylation domain-containing protein